MTRSNGRQVSPGEIPNAALEHHRAEQRGQAGRRRAGGRRGRGEPEPQRRDRHLQRFVPLAPAEMVDLVDDDQAEAIADLHHVARGAGEGGDGDRAQHPLAVAEAADRPRPHLPQLGDPLAQQHARGHEAEAGRAGGAPWRPGRRASCRCPWATPAPRGGAPAARRRARPLDTGAGRAAADRTAGRAPDRACRSPRRPDAEARTRWGRRGGPAHGASPPAHPRGRRGSPSGSRPAGDIVQQQCSAVEGEAHARSAMPSACQGWCRVGAAVAAAHACRWVSWCALGAGAHGRGALRPRASRLAGRSRPLRRRRGRARRSRLGWPRAALRATTGAGRVPRASPGRARASNGISGGARPIGGAYLQGDNNDEYVVSGSEDGLAFRELWVARPVAEPGLRGRTSGPLSGRARFIRLTARGGDGHYSVSELRLFSGPAAGLLGTRLIARGGRGRFRTALLYLLLAAAALLFGTRGSTPPKTLVALGDRHGRGGARLRRGCRRRLAARGAGGLLRARRGRRVGPARARTGGVAALAGPPGGGADGRGHRRRAGVRLLLQLGPAAVLERRPGAADVRPRPRHAHLPAVRQVLRRAAATTASTSPAFSPTPRTSGAVRSMRSPPSRSAISATTACAGSASSGRKFARCGRAFRTRAGQTSSET